MSTKERKQDQSQQRNQITNKQQQHESSESYARQTNYIQMMQRGTDHDRKNNRQANSQSPRQALQQMSNAGISNNMAQMPNLKNQIETLQANDRHRITSSGVFNQKNMLNTGKSLEDAQQHRYMELYQAEKVKLQRKELANQQIVMQISKKLKQQEKRSYDESKVAIELRKRYDLLKKKCEKQSKDKENTLGQLKSLFGMFTQQRKALEVSIRKNKHFEQENDTLTGRNRQLEAQNKDLKRQIEQLENDKEYNTKKYKKQITTLENELDDKKTTVTRQMSEYQEVCTQKNAIKQQLEEYEQKIKKLIQELETESKKHIKEIKQLQEHYMGFKSNAAELQQRIDIYKRDYEQANFAARDSKKEVVRLTFENDEINEKARFLERKYYTLVKRLGASQEVLNAIDEELLLKSSHKPKASPQKYGNDAGNSARNRNQSRLEKRRDNDEVVDSYEYYGQQQEDSEAEIIASGRRKNHQQQHHLNLKQNHAVHSGEQIIEGRGNKQKKTNIEVLDLHDEDDNRQQYYDNNQQPHEQQIQQSESGDLLKKLIDNIENNHALKNEQIRDQFKLHDIQCEGDLHKYKNLLNAMAALFFTNHRMNDVTMLFNVWRKAALQKMNDRENNQKSQSPSLIKSSQPTKAPPMEIDTELANKEIMQEYENEENLERVLNRDNSGSDKDWYQKDAVDQQDDSPMIELSPDALEQKQDAEADKQARKFFNNLKKIGPYSKQILNYSYPPLLYQRGEDDEDEDEDDMSDEEGEEEEDENSAGCSEGDMIDLPNFHNSDDDNVDALVDNLNDTSDHLLNKLQRAVDSNEQDNEFDDEHRQLDPNLMLDPQSLDKFSEHFGDQSDVRGGHATNLDDLDQEQILKMMEQEVDGIDNMDMDLEMDAMMPVDQRGDQHNSTIINSSQNTSLEANFPVH